MFSAATNGLPRVTAEKHTDGRCKIELPVI